MTYVALFNLPIDLLPDVNLPVLTIQTRIPGYLPEEVETIVTRPVEDQVTTLNNVHSVRSTSSEGLSVVTIAFNLGSKMDYAIVEVRERLNQLKNILPKDAQHPGGSGGDPSYAALAR